MPPHPLPPSWPHSCCCFTTCFYMRMCDLATATSCCPVPAGSTSTPLTSLLSCPSDTCSHMHRRNRGSMQVCWWRGSNEASSCVQPFQQWFSASHSVSRCSAEISQSLFSFASNICSNANFIYSFKVKNRLYKITALLILLCDQWKNWWMHSYFSLKLYLLFETKTIRSFCLAKC